MATESIVSVNHRELIDMDLPLLDAITATDAAGLAAAIGAPASGSEVSELAEVEAEVEAAVVLAAAAAAGVHACSDYKEAIYDLANASWRQLGDVRVMTVDSGDENNQQLEAQPKPQPQPEQQEQLQAEFSFFQFPVVPERTKSLPIADRRRLGEELSGNDGWAGAHAGAGATALPVWCDMRAAAEEVRCVARREQGYCLFARGGSVCSPGGLGGFSVPVQ